MVSFQKQRRKHDRQRQKRTAGCLRRSIDIEKFGSDKCVGVLPAEGQKLAYGVVDNDCVGIQKQYVFTLSHPDPLVICPAEADVCVIEYRFDLRILRAKHLARTVCRDVVNHNNLPGAFGKLQTPDGRGETIFSKVFGIVTDNNN